MQWKTSALAASVLLALALGTGTHPVGTAYAACDPGDRVDGSTADQAKKKMEHAGFSQVQGLKKGCDNFWHGQAMKDGKPANVVLSPQGQVMEEGD